MSRSQSLLLFFLIGAVVTTVIVAQPAQPAGAIPFPVGGFGFQGSAATDAPPQAGPTPTMLPTSSPLPLPYISQDGPPPQAISASELQTSLPGLTPAASGTLPPDWSPPGMEGPLALHPFDHFWLYRPVAADENNEGHPYYAYGSDGNANDQRVHHGIDISNAIGVQVIAAGDGLVIEAGKGSINEDEAITAYGNTVVIQHDFGYNGEPVYTLYAHLSAILVEEGQRVQIGELLGLVGATGNATGPHVHFEVRIGHNNYASVRNPDLWIIPYIGTGVIAGQVLLDNGEPAYDSTISLYDVDTGDEIYRTSSYASSSIKSDDNWGETFTIPDVPEGRYFIRARHEYGVWTGQVTVFPGMTNWVEMVRTSRPASTPTPTP
jgi:murein DD-endopeptidase MepM/ murein hydrolase activator NlpD